MTDTNTAKRDQLVTDLYPTVMDRLIQQAIHQVLIPPYDPTFSAHSYGYRPGRSAGQAVRQARKHIAAGYSWVVDLDLENFFDRVNHDILMSRLVRRIEDKRLLKLIRRYLEAEMMAGGLESARSEGIPQGAPPPLHCSPTSCWTSWMRNWKPEGTTSAATPMTATSTSKANGSGCGYWTR